MLPENIDAALLDEAILLARAAHPSDRDPEDSASAVDRLIAGESPYSVERQALNTFLERLTPDQLADLLALMWLGRGDASEEPSGFPGLVRTARDQDHPPDYMASKPGLAEYLDKGRALLRTDLQR